MVSVPTKVETAAVGVVGDAADDPAIWIADRPAHSRVIGTQKQGGYYVYDLAGHVVQEVLLGRPNNVDLVERFAWRRHAAPLVVASDRADNTVPLFRFDPSRGMLDPVPRARIVTGFAEVYGVCAGQSGHTTFVVATSKIGEVRVWTIEDGPRGIVPTLVTDLALGSIAEGCVVDGAASAVFVSQELVGLWRIPLGATDGQPRTLVDGVAPAGHLTADVEGVSVWKGRATQGYIVVSSQGASRFDVYDRARPHAYRGGFEIAPGPGGDGVNGTDGIAVSSTPIGRAFPRGILVVQDDDNTDPAETQNFKYVSWADVEARLGLR